MAIATRYEELLSWQRMHELNIEVFRATDSGRVSRDFKFRDEIREAADSAERNVAEGFARYTPAAFANFLDYSRASAAETRSMLRKGAECGYFSAEDFARLDSLAARGAQAVAKLQRYLRSPQAKSNAARRRYSRRLHPKNESNESNDPNDPNGELPR